MDPTNSTFLVSLETSCDYFTNALQIVHYFGTDRKIKGIWMPGPNEKRILIEFSTAEDYKSAAKLISRKSKNYPDLHLNMTKIEIADILPNHVIHQQRARSNHLSWRTSYSNESRTKSRSVTNLKEIGSTRRHTESLNDDLPITGINKLSLNPPTSKFFMSDNTRTQVTERPKLNLLPRTKPLNSKPECEKRSSIFGNAKPVDTLSRELEIEERLEKEKVENTKIQYWRSTSSPSNVETKQENIVSTSISSTIEENLARINASSDSNQIDTLDFMQVAEDLTMDSNQHKLRERKEAYQLYQCLMENVGDDVSTQEFQLHHKASRSLVLENFKEQTENHGSDLDNHIFETLSNEIEAHYELLKSKREDKEKGHDTALPAEMMQAISSVILAYENNMMDEITELKYLKDRHAVALANALDFFDLLTEFMLENKSSANKKVLHELNAAYERIQEHHNSIFLQKRCQEIEIWFEKKLKNFKLDFKQCTKLKQTALMKFDEILNEFPDSTCHMIISQRQNLKKALTRELKNFAECMAVSHRSETVEEYRRAMSAACESHSSERRLGELNAMASQASMDNYTLKTSGLPQEVVTEQRNALIQCIADESEKFKTAIIEKIILKRHEKQTQELSRAYTSGLEVYMSMTEQPKDCEGDVLNELEVRHVTAQDIALNTFNLMTENLAPQLTAASRDKLVADLSKRYAKYKKFLTEQILKQQVKIAQAAFSERMRLAVQVDEMFTRLQVQAQNETLVNFDLTTSKFDREAVAEYRAKLEESFEFCLEVVQKLRSSSDFPAPSDTGLCCVCSENRASVVFQPCLHLNTCDTCAANLTTCAMCRATIQNKLHVYQ